MTHREEKNTREKLNLNKDLKFTLDKEQIRDLDPKDEHKDLVRGGQGNCATCTKSV